jgi:hypothetical protein
MRHVLILNVRLWVLGWSSSALRTQGVPVSWNYVCLYVLRCCTKLVYLGGSHQYLSLAGWSTPAKVGVGVGAALGTALFLAGCIIVGVLLRKAGKKRVPAPQVPAPSTPLAKATGFKTRRDGAGAQPPPQETTIDVLTPSNRVPTHNQTPGGPFPFNTASPSGVACTALDLLNGHRVASTVRGNARRSAPGLVRVVVEARGANSPGEPSVVDVQSPGGVSAIGLDNAPRHQRGASTSRDRMGRTDSAHTLHFLDTDEGEQVSKDDGEMPNAQPS